ncbi:hypothetical protein TKK_0002576 [Trichogramma kaykai]|uniref:DDE Tnp4 domain-containing protein n=1 Tax=Trichogramma kaykai TaxID=54128 RepID=A0ABD2WYQ7_9HYME
MAVEKLTRKRLITDILTENIPQSNKKMCTTDNLKSQFKPLTFGEGPSTSEIVSEIEKTNKDKAVKHFRSKSTMCNFPKKSVSCQTQVMTADFACSPKSASSIETSTATTVSSKQSTSELCYVPSTGTSSSSSNEKYSDRECDKIVNEKTLELTIQLIKSHPKKFIGVPANCLWILNLLENSMNVSEGHILLVLMKMKTNDTYSRLRYQFGLSLAQTSNICHQNFHHLAHFLKTFIYVPSVLQVKQNLPIPFRAFYSKVFVIIDAFEVQIQKPSDSVHQALTWSEYKKCCGGRISDNILFAESGILDILPENTTLMADRGFKSIEKVLKTKNVKLVRPPSVYTCEKPTKEQALETKRIASLRIHVERVIRRIREFHILTPHSCLDLSLLSVLDSITISVCGLINLQSPIIKT